MATATRRASRTRRTRTAITFAAAGLLSIVIAPAAFAAPNGDQGVAAQPGDGAVAVQVPAAGAVASEDQGTADGSDELEAAGDLEVSDHLDSIDAVVELDTSPGDGEVAVLAAAACDDHLVTLTPAGATGPAPQAVAITAQAHEWGQSGWDMASWAASEGTTIRTVLAQSPDGATSTPAAAPTGTAYDVAALTFCGTSDTDGSAAGASAEADASAAEVAPESADTATPAPSGTDDANSTAGENTTDAAGASAEAPSPTSASNTAPQDEPASDEAATTPAPGDTGSASQLDTTGTSTTTIAPDAGSDGTTTDASTSDAAAGGELPAVPVASSSPTAVADGPGGLGSTAIGLLTVGLLAAALLALAAFRRRNDTTDIAGTAGDHAHLGGQA